MSEEVKKQMFKLAKDSYVTGAVHTIETLKNTLIPGINELLDNILKLMINTASVSEYEPNPEEK